MADFECSVCNACYQVDDSLDGKTIRCRNCDEWGCVRLCKLAAKKKVINTKARRFDMKKMLLRGLAGLTVILCLVFVISIIVSDYSVKDVNVRDAERKMEQAWRDMPNSRDATERFVDGYRSYKVAQDTPEWATTAQKTIWLAAALALFGPAVFALLKASGDIN